MAEAFDVNAFDTLRASISANRGYTPESPPVREPIDVSATKQALAPFSQGQSNLVVLPTGQVTSESTPEFQNFKKQFPQDADKLQQLSHMMRTFYASDYSLLKKERDKKQLHDRSYSDMKTIPSESGELFCGCGSMAGERSNPFDTHETERRYHAKK